jgi:hypothetical protein
MSIQVTRFVRKMRGGAQAHLLECDDGYFYVVKFRNNPQHRRILVNEWIASVFLKYLQIATPEIAIINLSADFVAANADVHIQLGSRRQAIESGGHFGSRYPGDPASVMVYDFVPDQLLDRVVNQNEFLGVLAFDKWVANADARQAFVLRTLATTVAVGASQLPTSGVRRSYDGPRLRPCRSLTEPSLIRRSRDCTFAQVST